MPASEGRLSQDSFLEVSFKILIAASTTLAFAASGKTITRAAGSWITDGVVAGMRIETGSATNPGPFLIKTVTSATVLTLADDETVANESAAAYDATIWAEVAEVVSLNTPDGEPSEIDVTHLRSEAREFRNGLRDEGSISGEMNFVPDDPGQIIMTEMKSEKYPRTVRITIPPDEQENLSGYQWTFPGLVRGTPVSLAVDEKASKAFTIRVAGAVEEAILEAA